MKKFLELIQNYNFYIVKGFDFFTNLLQTLIVNFLDMQPCKLKVAFLKKNHCKKIKKDLCLKYSQGHDWFEL